MKMKLAHFQTSQYVAEHICHETQRSSNMHATSVLHQHRSVERVEYISSHLRVTRFHSKPVVPFPRQLPAPSVKATTISDFALSEIGEYQDGEKTPMASAAGGGTHAATCDDFRLSGTRNTEKDTRNTVTTHTSQAAAARAAVCGGALLTFVLPPSWQWKANTVLEALDVTAEDATQPSEPAEMQGHWMHKEDDSLTPTGLESLIGPVHEYMGVYTLNRHESRGIDTLDDNALAGVEGLRTLLCDPVGLLDTEDKALMHSVLPLLQQVVSAGHTYTHGKGKAVGNSDTIKGVTQAHVHVAGVVDCMELHSGIALGRDHDSLALFYRLKMPLVVGGYETAWKPLCSYNLNTNAVFFFECMYTACVP